MLLELARDIKANSAGYYLNVDTKSLKIQVQNVYARMKS